MHLLHCAACGQQVYFENTQCSLCGARLGFLPDELAMGAFAAPDGTLEWPRVGPFGPRIWQACTNRMQHGVCNWMLPADDAQANGGYCQSCRLTSMVPSLDDAANMRRWTKIESAKRRLMYTLLSLNLPMPRKQSVGDMHGLEFRWLADIPGGQHVMTGHEDGVVTLNIAEADDDRREAERVRLGEPLRTLLGHLRHECSHYLHQRFVENGPLETEFRNVFGDERVDYSQSLETHYRQGPPADWNQRFISSYASSHPWEDWAETCAHYLLMVDAVETARAWGLSLGPGLGHAPADAGPVDATDIGDWVRTQWLPVARFLNAMSRSLGLLDSYPFTVSNAVLDKLALVQKVLRGAAQGPPTQTQGQVQAAMPAVSAGAQTRPQIQADVQAATQPPLPVQSAAAQPLA